MLMPVAVTKNPAPAQQKVPAIARFLPSLTDLAFLLPVIFLFLRLDGARTMLGDGDTGWHIRTGEWILTNHRVPTTDMFSFSRSGAPWFAWEWLWDVLFAVLHQRWGMGAVVAASVGLLCMTSAMLFRLTRRKCGNGLVAMAVTLLATGGCAIHWLARPHLFTLFFLTLSLHIIERAVEGRMKLLWWLPPITLLWTNLHGGFFVLFLVFACYIAHDAIHSVLRGQFDPRLKQWGAAFTACFAVTFINPYGWQLHKHVVEYITDPYQLQHITEFQSMNFHSPVVMYFEPLMALAIAACVWNVRRGRFADVFLTMGWLHLALIAQRNAPLFSIVAAPIAALAIVETMEAARRFGVTPWMRRAAEWMETSSASFDETDRIGRVFLASALPLAVVSFLLVLPKPVSASFSPTYDPQRYPERALSLLRGPETQHIFAEDEWGDYLIYRLYPNKKVFIDGRSDFYGDEFGERYLDLMEVKHGWQGILNRYAIDTIVISPKFALTSTLKISPDWRVVYDDGIALIFRRAVRPNSSLAPFGDHSREGKSDLTITQPTTQRRSNK